jgi:hypothetical protein
MDAICSSETSVDTQRTIRRHIPEYDTPVYMLVTTVNRSSYVSAVFRAVMILCSVDMSVDTLHQRCFAERWLRCSPNPVLECSGIGVGRWCWRCYCRRGILLHWSNQFGRGGYLGPRDAVSFVAAPVRRSCILCNCWDDAPHSCSTTVC